MITRDNNRNKSSNCVKDHVIDSRLQPSQTFSRVRRYTLVRTEWCLPP